MKMERALAKRHLAKIRRVVEQAGHDSPTTLRRATTLPASRVCVGQATALLAPPGLPALKPQSTAKIRALHRRGAVAWPPWGVQLGKPADANLACLPAQACLCVRGARRTCGFILFCSHGAFTGRRRAATRVSASGGGKSRTPRDCRATGTDRMHGAAHTLGYASVR